MARIARWFLDITLDSETLRWWSGTGDIALGSQTYTGLGTRFITPESLKRKASLKSEKIELEFDSSRQSDNSDPIGHLLDQKWRNRAVRLRRIGWLPGETPDAGIVLADERGRVRNLSDSLQKDKPSIITMEIESGALAYLERRMETRSPASQGLVFPGDKGFDLIAQLEGVTLPWRTKYKKTGTKPFPLEDEYTPYPREMQIGRFVTAGSFIYADTNQQQRKSLCQVFALADHRIKSLDRIWINGKLERSTALVHGQRTLQRVENDKGEDRCWVTFYDGRPDQIADPFLVSVASTWTSAHRLRGIAYIIVEHRWDSDMANAYDYRFGGEGGYFYDRRLDTTAGGSGNQRWNDPTTWAYTQNAAVVADHYRSGIRVINSSDALWFGVGEPLDAVPYAEFEALADLCDENVTLKAGGTQKRYQVNGTLSAEKSHDKNLQKLADQMAARAIDQGGRISIRPPVIRTPVVTLTDADLVRESESVAEPGGRIDDMLNTIEGRFINPANDYKNDDYPKVQIAAYLEDDNGEISDTLNFDLETSAERAQRIAKLKIEDSRRIFVLTETYGTKAKAIEPGEWFVRQSTIRGFPSGKTFVADEVTRFIDGSMEVVASEVDPDQLVWDEETAVDLSVPPAFPQLTLEDLETPGGTGTPRTIIKDDVNLPGVDISITYDPDALPYETDVEVTRDDGAGGPLSGAEVLRRTLPAGRTVLTLSGELMPGTDYVFRARAKFDGRVGDWSDWVQFTTPSVYSVPASSFAAGSEAAQAISDAQTAVAAAQQAIQTLDDTSQEALQTANQAFAKATSNFDAIGLADTKAGQALSTAQDAVADALANFDAIAALGGTVDDVQQDLTTALTNAGNALAEIAALADEVVLVSSSAAAGTNPSQKGWTLQMNGLADVAADLPAFNWVGNGAVRVLTALAGPKQLVPFRSDMIIEVTAVMDVTDAGDGTFKLRLVCSGLEADGTFATNYWTTFQSPETYTQTGTYTITRRYRGPDAPAVEDSTLITAEDPALLRFMAGVVNGGPDCTAEIRSIDWRDLTKTLDVEAVAKTAKINSETALQNYEAQELLITGLQEGVQARALTENLETLEGVVNAQGDLLGIAIQDIQANETELQSQDGRINLKADQTTVTQIQTDLAGKASSQSVTDVSARVLTLEESAFVQLLHVPTIKGTESEWTNEGAGFTVTSGSDNLLFSSTVVRTQGQDAGGPGVGSFYTIAPEFEAALEGNGLQTYRVTIRARSADTNGASKMGAAYSTNNVGNTTWRIFDLTSSYQEFTFEADFNETTPSEGDFICISGDAEGTGKRTEVEWVKLDVEAPPSQRETLTSASLAESRRALATRTSSEAERLTALQAAYNLTAQTVEGHTTQLQSTASIIYVDNSVADERQARNTAIAQQEADFNLIIGGLTDTVFSNRAEYLSLTTGLADGQQAQQDALTELNASVSRIASQPGVVTPDSEEGWTLNGWSLQTDPDYGSRLHSPSANAILHPTGETATIARNQIYRLLASVYHKQNATNSGAVAWRLGFYGFNAAGVNTDNNKQLGWSEEPEGSVSEQTLLIGGAGVDPSRVDFVVSTGTVVIRPHIRANPQTPADGQVVLLEWDWGVVTDFVALDATVKSQTQAIADLTTGKASASAFQGLQTAYNGTVTTVAENTDAISVAVDAIGANASAIEQIDLQLSDPVSGLSALATKTEVDALEVSLTGVLALVESELSARLDTLEAPEFTAIFHRETTADSVSEWTPVTNRTVEAGDEYLVFSSTVSVAQDDNAGSETGGVYLKLPADIETLIEGSKTYKVTVSAKAHETNGASKFAAAYSTDFAGNTGWQVFELTSDYQEFSFTGVFDDPSPVEGDYFGIIGDAEGTGKKTAVRWVQLSILADPDEQQLISDAAMRESNRVAATRTRAEAFKLALLTATVEDPVTGLGGRALQTSLNQVISDVAGKLESSAFNTFVAENDDDLAAISTSLSAVIDQSGQTATEFAEFRASSGAVNENKLANTRFTDIETVGNNKTPAGWVNYTASTDPITFGVTGGQPGELHEQWTPTGERALFIFQNGTSATGEAQWATPPIDEYIIPAGQGDYVIVSALAGAHRASSLLLPVFYRADGSFLSHGTEQSSVQIAADEKLGGKSLSDFKPIYSRARAPAGTAYAGFLGRKRATSSGANSYFFILRPKLEIVSEDQLLPSPFQHSGEEAVRSTVVRQIAEAQTTNTEARGLLSTQLQLAFEAADTQLESDFNLVISGVSDAVASNLIAIQSLETAVNSPTNGLATKASDIRVDNVEATLEGAIAEQADRLSASFKSSKTRLYDFRDPDRFTDQYTIFDGARTVTEWVANEPSVSLVTGNANFDTALKLAGTNHAVNFLEPVLVDPTRIYEARVRAYVEAGDCRLRFQYNSWNENKALQWNNLRTDIHVNGVSRTYLNASDGVQTLKMRFRGANAPLITDWTEGPTFPFAASDKYIRAGFRANAAGETSATAYFQSIEWEDVTDKVTGENTSKANKAEYTNFNQLRVNDIGALGQSLSDLSVAFSGLEDEVDTKAAITALQQVETDANTARGLLSTSLTNAFTDADAALEANFNLVISGVSNAVSSNLVAIQSLEARAYDGGNQVGTTDFSNGRGTWNGGTTVAPNFGRPWTHVLRIAGTQSAYDGSTTLRECKEGDVINFKGELDLSQSGGETVRIGVHFTDGAAGNLPSGGFVTKDVNSTSAAYPFDFDYDAPAGSRFWRAYIIGPIGGFTGSNRADLARPWAARVANGAEVKVISGAVADIEDAAAYHVTEVAATDSDPAIVSLKAGKNGSAIGLAAKIIRLINNVGGTTIEVMRAVGGYVFFSNPISIDRGGKRLTLGSNDDFVLWCGPDTIDPPSQTLANSDFTFGVSGLRKGTDEIVGSSQNKDPLRISLSSGSLDADRADAGSLSVSPVFAGSGGTGPYTFKHTPLPSVFTQSGPDVSYDDLIGSGIGVSANSASNNVLSRWTVLVTMTDAAGDSVSTPFGGTFTWGTPP